MLLWHKQNQWNTRHSEVVISHLSLRSVSICACVLFGFRDASNRNTKYQMSVGSVMVLNKQWLVSQSTSCNTFWSNKQINLQKTFSSAAYKIIAKTFKWSRHLFERQLKAVPTISFKIFMPSFIYSVCIQQLHICRYENCRKISFQTSTTYTLWKLNGLVASFTKR